MAHRLGILVVGQSPRTDVEEIFRRALGSTEIDLCGCLDGMSRSEIAACAPEPGENTLFTRLPSGDGVRLSKAKVTEHGLAQLQSLAASGADATVVLCTGDFPSWERKGVIFASVIFRHVVQALLSNGRLGVVTPLESQVPQMTSRWTAMGYETMVIALSPNAPIEDADRVGRAYAGWAPDLIALDCVSYTQQTKAAVCRGANCRGALAITAIARVASELFDMDEGLTAAN